MEKSGLACATSTMVPGASAAMVVSGAMVVSAESLSLPHAASVSTAAAAAAIIFIFLVTVDSLVGRCGLGGSNRTVLGV
ncbi:MAG: hypothetical protein ACKOFF_01155 [Acidimicrobiales bacterium]